MMIAAGEPPSPSLSFELPDELKLAIADAVITFAKLEMAVEELIWELVGVKPGHGKMLTRMDARPKFELVQKLILELFPVRPKGKEFPNIWKAMEDLRNKRNDIVHGYWAILDGKPVTVSHRYMADPGQTGIRHTTLAELRLFTRRTETLEDHFVKHAGALRSSRSKSALQPPSDLPAPPAAKSNS